jgi:hypothetical protein
MEKQHFREKNCRIISRRPHTPTIFINGKRGPKFPSLDELRQWIAEADQNATELAGNAKTQPEKKEVNQK